MIGSMQLGPSLFKDTYPDFSISAGGEGWWTAIWLTWEVVIYNDWLLDPINEKPHHINARFIYGLGHEQILDAVWIFG